MLSDSLMRAVSAPLNILFLALLAVVFLWSIQAGPRQLQLQRMRTAPGVLITIGILGTFTGILVGLLGFDVSSVETSVPQLLSGMTTAFLSSVTGLMLALLVRGVASYRLRGAGVSTASTATLADLNATLVQIDRRLTEGLSHIRGEVVQLREAIGGQGDSTLIGQIKLMRFDQEQASKQLIKVLEDFADKVSELGSKALIEALKEVISDFNTNLTEQFGDNFKQLNLAVERLVAWQENYRVHVEALEAQFGTALLAVRGAEESVKEIAAAARPLPEVHQRLATILEELHEENEELEQRLKRFAELGEKAVEALPIVEENIDRITTGFSETVADGLFTIQAAQREHERSAQQLREAFAALHGTAEGIVETNAAKQRDLQKSFSESMAVLESQLREMHSQSARKWQETLKEQVERQQDAIRQQLDNLDGALKHELTEALNKLSAHLLGLHEQLVRDYAPLLNAMRRVVELGGRGERP